LAGTDETVFVDPKGWVARTDRRFQTLWRLPVYDGVKALVVLADSVVAFTENHAVQVDARGRIVEDGYLGNVSFLAAVAVGDHDVVEVHDTASATVVARLRFLPVTVAPLPAGSVCAGDADCWPARCCYGAPGMTAACSTSAKCGAGSACATDSDCSGGACYVPTGATAGVCTEPCTSSTACPVGTYCVLASGGVGACLTDCLGMASACAALSSALVCRAGMNTEGISVSTCR
jgi:hypothetical protein